jgi:hypothetical protein
VRRVQIAVISMLCFSATFDIFQFLKYSGSGNAAYIMVPGSPTTTRHNEPYLYASSPHLSQHEI